MENFTNKTTAFLGLNIDLIENKLYKDLDIRAMVLYSLYADRATTSLYNARMGNTTFVDSKGVFIRYTNTDAAAILRVSEKLIGKLRKQLVACNLITIVRDGLKGYKIYVHSVKKTPKDTERLMPWKNHNVQIVKFVSNWTTFAKIEFAKNLGHTSRYTETTVKDNSESLCQSNRLTSLSTAELTNINNNDLVDNARESKINSKFKKINTSNYYSLPDKIKTAFNNAFGFITNQVAIELHNLIDQSSVDMVNYAIESNKDRRLSRPIAYLKAVIINALKRGNKTAQDMKDYYENMVKVRKYPRRFMTKQMVDKLVAEDEKKLKQSNPKLWSKVQEIKRKAQQRANNKPIIPIYKLGE
ncbi:replication initiator protein A [Limosilactobacillus reuteri]|uniref:DnaD domain protein n=1 Tax=Limosilactobacillus reuteri TaxID=1598 RepID=UPI001E5ED27C|nr:DnaD domain protein [Limosilactobacillus reuteri]MCC4370508.1 replication initiator protein A [Limosilactobacillus reuteri]MCC4509437.1 replication initiator protein A [Limosilactobacillus reuteri]